MKQFDRMFFYIISGIEGILNNHLSRTTYTRHDWLLCYRKEKGFIKKIESKNNHMMAVKIENGKMIADKNANIEIKTFKELNILETQIESFVEENIGHIFSNANESLFIFGRQTYNTASQHSDLIALDVETGDLVVIEIKRDVSDIRGRGEKVIAQAIKYAASLATIDSVDQMVKLYAKYISTGKDEEQEENEARQVINKQTKDLELNTNQRIVILASEFDGTTLASAEWLWKKGISIELIKLTPMVFADNLLLDIEVVLGENEKRFSIPYKISNGDNSREDIETRRYLPRMPKLFEWELISSGDKAYIKRKTVDKTSEATVIDESYVNYQNEKMTYNEWGQKVTGWSSIRIYKYVVLNDSEKTLDELRIEKQQENEEMDIDKLTT